MSGLDILGGLIADIADVASEPAFFAVALWLLAGVFAVSGFAKLRQPALAAFAIADFGVVSRPNPRHGTALGIFEVALAASLAAMSAVAGLGASVVAGAAAVLLWIFVILIIRSLSAGDRFECFCFGRSDSSLSARTVLRTAALAILATVTSVGLAGTDALTPSALVGSAAIGMGTLSVFALVSRVPDLLAWNSDPFGLNIDTVRR